jgi:hypothetical protein
MPSVPRPKAQGGPVPGDAALLADVSVPVPLHAFEASAMAPGDCGAANLGGDDVFRIGEIVA